MRLMNLTREVRWMMAEEFDKMEANRTLLVPSILNEEGKEDYSSVVRDGLLNFDDKWVAEQLHSRGLVARAEAPGRATGAAARAISPQVVAAFVQGEIIRLHSRALCRVAIESNLPDVVVYYAEDSLPATSECAQHEGRKVKARALQDWLQTATLDEFLGLSDECPKSAFSVRLP